MKAVELKFGSCKYLNYQSSIIFIMVAINRILVPTDCSDLSKNALKSAIKMAQTFNAKLTLLMVVQKSDSVDPNNRKYLSLSLVRKMRDEFERENKKKLRNFWNTAFDPEIPVEHVILKGNPYLQIIDYAKKSNSDMIVMGTHGRTGLQHLVMGSVAEKVVRYSRVPVLTVKQQSA